MFYETLTPELLRFGDVLQGYVLANTNIECSFSSFPHPNYTVEITSPKFVVVLSPCCSIGEKKIILTPLIQIRKSYIDNPYFKGDLTNINRKMSPEQAVTPNVWSRLSPGEIEKRNKEGINYGLIEFFIFENHDLFPTYSISDKDKANFPDTNYYMIDFRNTFKVASSALESGNKKLIPSKCLELSIQTRTELRDKISYFYSRVPQEDVTI